MSVYYKYLDQRGGLNTISRLALRSSNIRGLNDPFEFNPIIEFAELSPNEIREFFRQEAAKLHENQTVSELADEDARKLYAKMCENFTGSQLAERADEFFVILSFSASYLSPSMWAHYADRHAGICVGFDFQEFPFSGLQQVEAVSDVQYPVQRAGFSYNPLCTTQFRRELKRISCLKGKMWEHEQERRIVLPKADNKELGSFFYKEKGDNNVDYYFLHIPIEAWRQVIFGMNMTESDINTFLQLADSVGLTHCKFYQAILSADSWEMELKELVNTPRTD